MILFAFLPKIVLYIWKTSGFYQLHQNLLCKLFARSLWESCWDCTCSCLLLYVNSCQCYTHGWVQINKHPMCRWLPYLLDLQEPFVIQSTFCVNLPRIFNVLIQHKEFPSNTSSNFSAKLLTYELCSRREPLLNWQMLVKRVKKKAWLFLCLLCPPGGQVREQLTYANFTAAAFNWLI